MTSSGNYTNWMPGKDAYITLEALIPDPTKGGVRLGYSALGASWFGDLHPKTFKIGTSWLGSGRLHPVPPDLIWYDLTGWALSVDTFRGNRTDTPMMPPDLGTLSVRFRNVPRLSALGIHTGTPIRVTAMSRIYGKHVLWSGTVEDIDEDRDPRAGADQYTTLEAVDAMRALGTVTRYGQKGGGGSWWRFYTAIYQTAPAGLVYPSYEGGGEDPVIDTLHETALADHLSNLAVGSFRWTLKYSMETETITTPTGDVTVEAPTFATACTWNPDYVTATYTDIPRDPRSYYRCKIRQGSSALVTAAKITSYGIDPANPTQTRDVSQTVSDPTALATYGTRSIEIGSYLPPDRVDPAGRLMLSEWVDPAPTVTELTVPGEQSLIEPWGSGRTRWTVDPLDAIDVVNLGRRYRLIVGTVAHHITPHDWRTTYTTARRS